MTPGKSHLVFLNWSVRVGAFVVLSIGAAVLVGWAANVAFLKTLLPGLASMKFNTAIGFVAAATSLLSYRPAPSRPPWRRRVARALAIFVVVLGGLNLLEDTFGLDLGIDQLVVHDPGAVIGPGRMAPGTALNFIFFGLSMLALRASRPQIASVANWLVGVPFFLSTLAILGYAYGVSSLYKVGPFTSMALHTALAFFVLSLSLLAANPSHGIASLLASEGAGGAVARRLLPTIPLTLFFVGWLCLLGLEAGFYDTPFGLALMVLLSIAVSMFSISATASALRTVDIQRKRAEDDIVQLNVGLERTVAVRTAELTQSSANLRAANVALETLSLHDALTGLANRRSFDGYLATQIALARRHKRPLALVLCDVDRFKAYNDHKGHPAGDAVLKQISDVLRAVCRRPTDMAARYGGEEFCLVLPDTDRVGADLIAEAARSAIERLGIAHGRSPASSFVTISGGVANLLDGLRLRRAHREPPTRCCIRRNASGRNRTPSDHAPRSIQAATA